MSVICCRSAGVVSSLTWFTDFTGTFVAYSQEISRRRHREQVGRCKSHLTFVSEQCLQDFCREFSVLSSGHLFACRLREGSVIDISCRNPVGNLLRTQPYSA